MERFKVMKASGSKHSLNKYYGATADDLENTAGLLEMTSVLDNSQIDENTPGTRHLYCTILPHRSSSLFQLITERVVKIIMRVTLGCSSRNRRGHTLAISIP